MNGRPFFDTNVLVYAFGEDARRSEPARALLAQGGLISVQSLNEFVSVARRKLGMSWEEILEGTAAIVRLCPSPTPLTFKMHGEAIRIAMCYGFRMYDALLVAAALEAGCPTFYSEDLQDSQSIDGLMIRNPFLR